MTMHGDQVQGMALRDLGLLAYSLLPSAIGISQFRQVKEEEILSSVSEDSEGIEKRFPNLPAFLTFQVIPFSGEDR
jgi:hypothetical protein